MKNLITSLFVFICVLCVGQDKTYTVVALKGQVNNGGKKLAIGQTLPADATVEVSDASYIGMIHKSGNPLEFKARGSYQLKSYSEKLAASNKGFKEKYMDYVVNGMTKKTGSSAYQNNMKVTGSVDRAIARNEIIIPLPTKVTLLTNQFDLEWMDAKTANQYEVLIKNMKEEKIGSLTTGSTTVGMDWGQFTLEPEQYYLVSIRDASNNRKSNVVNFYIPSEKERADILKELTEIVETMDMNSSVGCMAYGQICEEKGLLLEAFRAYKKAKDLSPDEDTYSKAYQDFMDGIVASM